MKNKECFKCHKEKPLSEFYEHPEMADGHLNKCKECTQKDVSKNYRKNIDHYKRYERDREKNEDRKQKKIQYQRKRRENNPKKYKARIWTTNALRDEKIQKQPCEICGSTINIEAHHEDYDKPQEITWLCFKHHRMTHGQLDYI